jgi:hypothetical protein
MGYSVVHIDEIEGAGPGNAVTFVRRRLGVEAFGIDWFEIPQNMEGVEHDETSSGQEEVRLGDDAADRRRPRRLHDARSRRAPRGLRAAGKRLRGG